jgi:hypothetical protein
MLYTNQNIPIESHEKINSWGEAFGLYFTIHEEIRAHDFDGGGAHSASRNIILNEEWL